MGFIFTILVRVRVTKCYGYVRVTFKVIFRVMVRVWVRVEFNLTIT